MNNLHEVLEICLQDIEQGADIDTVLFRYPEFAEELRPILEASVGARNMAVPAPSAEVVRRNRARVLGRAAQVREAKVKPASRRIWSASLRRVAVTLVVLALLFVSGTNLVRAASTTLPGDQLYPVKRTWEDVLLLFTFNSQQREALEIEHENERYHELRELVAEGRSEDVEFSGLVTGQNGNEWIVGGIPVVVSEQTDIRGENIGAGSAVRVEGQTQGTLTVFAEEIRLLPPDATLPDLQDDEGEKDDHEGEDRKEEDTSGKGSEGDAPKIEETQRPEGEKAGSSDDGSDDDKSGLDSQEDDRKSVEDHSSNDSDGDHSDSGGEEN